MIVRHTMSCLLSAYVLVVLASAPAVRAEEPLTFERHVRPILRAHCFQCHGEEDNPKAHLDLRLVRLMKQGGDSGEAIAPGHHDESLLWERIEADEMPPVEKKLSAPEKARIAAWIDQGARTERSEPESLAQGLAPTDEEKAFWSFQPVRRPDPPAVKDSARVATPIDAFLLARLEPKGLQFSPEADRTTLIRRLTFDLTGLPPTIDEVDQFLADTNPDAYERLVDRLLGSPRYGERWARHWLDVAGYADSDGYTPRDPERKYAYKYRDYIIRSINADRPWDELIREQLAGDEMLAPPYRDLAPADLDRLTATGFLRMAPDGTGDPSADQPLARNDVIAETIKIVSTSLLGLTVGCAQCHAHRYDPIPHVDYYRFRALFEPAYDPAHWRSPTARLVSLWTEADRARAAEVDAEAAKVTKEQASEIDALVQSVLDHELAEAPEELRGKLREARNTPRSKRTPEQLESLKTYPRVNVSPGNVSLYDPSAHGAITKKFAKRLAEIRKRRPPEDYVAALTEVPGQAPTTRLLFRGDLQQPRQPVAPGELSVLAASCAAPEIAPDDPALPTTGRRLAYAQHLTSGRHPLVARVFVNRVWLHHFGRGIVNTPADFGVLGERPSHPELLDWLADEFVRGGWRLKHLHRLIVTSTAYRQASARSEALQAIDPDDRLLGRMPVRRLEAEAVRDAILAASGQLTPTLYGAPVPVAPDEAGQVIVGVDNRDGAGRPVGQRASLGAAAFRRSLYIQTRRSLPLGLLETFDAPAMSPNCDRRASSTVAPQSLLMMNNDFVIEQSGAFAGRVQREAGTDPAAQVRLAWRLALGSAPRTAHVESALSFLKDQQHDFATQAPTKGSRPYPAERALATFCQVLLSSNGFLYVD